MLLFDHPEFSGHERVVVCHDGASGLRAIIAIHSTTLGPAAGGVRMWPYASDEHAVTDVLRLSRAMSFKNSLAGLPLGGGKSVIIGDPTSDRTPELLAAFARNVQYLGGAYWCAEDVGMGIDSIAAIGAHCEYVFGLPGQTGDPSPHTAMGVYLGMKAAVEHAFGDWPDGLQVAVQGLGNVGYHLCRDLHANGARLFVTDVSAPAVQRVVDEFGATAVAVDEIYSQDVDVFAPCAMGGVLNETTIPQLRAEVVAGAANNQLAEEKHGDLLAARGIVYAPDFLVNAGGMLSIGGPIFGEHDPTMIPARLEGIYAATRDLLAAAASSGVTTAEMAVRMARERIAAAS